MNRQDAKNAKLKETEMNAAGSRRRSQSEDSIGQTCEPDAALDQLAHQVIGAAIDVHRTLGPGYVESVYEEALNIELKLRGIPFVRQVAISIDYKGHRVGESRLDLLVGERLIVELKAVEALASVHTAQVLSYLKATRHRLGLLINFNVVMLKDGIQRVVLSPE